MKYEKGTFGYWWTVTRGHEDIEGQTYNDHIVIMKDITSFIGAPKVVLGDFDCSDNVLETLIGAPEHITGNFDCSYNNLETLKGSPIKVDGDYDCSHNNLKSLEGFPKSLEGDFKYNNNKNKLLKYEYKIRKDNPDIEIVNEEHLFQLMYEKTKDPKYLPQDLNDLFVI